MTAGRRPRGLRSKEKVKLLERRDSDCDELFPSTQTPKGWCWEGPPTMRTGTGQTG